MDENLTITQTDYIVCPECGKTCKATVQYGPMFPIFIHDCEHCGYIIMESEWQLIKDPKQVPDL